MTILAWILVGLAAGWVAKRVSPGLEPGGFIATLLIGIFGALLGGWVFAAFAAGPAGPLMGSLAVAAGGAAVSLAIWQSVAGVRHI
jgi:uncharacterized membrane protein YeaQ/YmgE (transglycosylase-associated protein family)